METVAPLDLGRRERQIMEAVYRLGRASVADVRNELPDPPTYSAVRGMLGLLERKGHLRHERDGLRHLYFPTVAGTDIGETTIRHMLKTFFAGSVSAAMAALLETKDEQPSDAELAKMAEMIERARKRGR